MTRTPSSARIYFILAAFLLALPTLSVWYDGYTGKFLVATHTAHGSFFEKTVIYVQRQDLFSASGVIVNKTIIDADGTEKRIGGPVDMDTIYPFKGFEFYGYSGWGPLQLNIEVFRGSWSVAEKDLVEVLAMEPDEIWDAFQAQSHAPLANNDGIL